MKKTLLIVIGIVFISIIASFFIEKETKPGGDTRVVLEHTYSTYIAPPCFESANATNNISDSTLDDAIATDYAPNDTCTEEALEGEEESLFVSLLKDIGFISKKWDNW